MAPPRVSHHHHHTVITILKNILMFFQKEHMAPLRVSHHHHRHTVISILTSILIYLYMTPPRVGHHRHTVKTLLKSIFYIIFKKDFIAPLRVSHHHHHIVITIIKSINQHHETNTFSMTWILAIPDSCLDSKYFCFLIYVYQGYCPYCPYDLKLK